jgi:hypothetical protein
MVWVCNIFEVEHIHFSSEMELQQLQGLLGEICLFEVQKPRPVCLMTGMASMKMTCWMSLFYWMAIAMIVIGGISLAPISSLTSKIPVWNALVHYEFDRW